MRFEFEDDYDELSPPVWTPPSVPQLYPNRP
jgi:hypothetical protein